MMKFILFFTLTVFWGNIFAQEELKLNGFSSKLIDTDIDKVLTTGVFDLNAKGDLSDSLTWGSLSEGFDVEYLGKSLSLELNSSQEILCQTGKKNYEGKFFRIPTSDFKYGAATCRNLSKEKNKVVYKLILSDDVNVQDLSPFNLESQRIISRVQANTFYDLTQINDRIKRLGRVIPDDFHYYSSLVGINSLEYSFDLKKPDFSISIPGENFYLELGHVQGGIDYRPLVGKKKHFNIDAMTIECRIGDKNFNLAQYVDKNLSIDGVSSDMNCHAQSPKKWLKRRIRGNIRFNVLLTNQIEFISHFNYVFKNYTQVITDQLDIRIKNLVDAASLALTNDVKSFYESKSELALMPFSFQKKIKVDGKANHYEINAVADKQVTDRGDIYFLSYIVTPKLWIALDERRAEISLQRKPIKILTKKIINGDAEAQKFSFTKTLDPINSIKLDFNFLSLSLATLKDESELETIKNEYSNYDIWPTLNGGTVSLVRNQFGLCYRQEKRDQEIVRIYDLGFAVYTSTLDEKVNSFSLNTPENVDSIPLNIEVKKIENPYMESELDAAADELNGYRCEVGSDSSFTREQVVQSLVRTE